MLPYQKLLVKIGSLSMSEIVELGKGKVTQMKDVVQFDHRHVKIVSGRPWSNPHKGLRSEQAFERYKEDILKLTPEKFVQLVTELRYKTLVCACPSVCHGHLLAVVANYELDDSEQLKEVSPPKPRMYECSEMEAAKLRENLPPPTPIQIAPPKPIFVTDGTAEVSLEVSGERFVVPVEWCESEISVTFDKKAYDISGDAKVVSHLIERYFDQLPIKISVNGKSFHVETGRLRLATNTRSGHQAGGWYSGKADGNLFFWIDQA